MKNIVTLTFFVLTLLSASSLAAEESPETVIQAAVTQPVEPAVIPAIVPQAFPSLAQSPAVNEAIRRAANPERKKELIAVIDTIDRIYGSIRDKNSGKKITIFFDPAHGMVTIGNHKDWQGNLTWRKSTTGKPEELYSIPICRRIYQLLTANPNIDVASTPDFLEVMKGSADIYSDVTFDESVNQAKKHDAFLIISEHLNNISPIWKADGYVNLEGCHITCDRWSTPMISYIDSVYKGYYTAYNIYDVTGSSRLVADRFRDHMLARGHKNNGWDNGAVADGRFSTSINYPVSVLFESGFISNPDDERKLTTQAFVGDIADSQYRALLDTIKTEFGVDISLSPPVIDPAAEGRAKSNIEAIKLSRIFVDCTQKGEFANALSALSSLEKHTSTGAHKWIAWPYSDMRKKIQRIASAFDTAAWREKKGPWKKAAANYRDAINTMGYHPLFNGIRENAYGKYNTLARKLGMRQEYYNYSIGYQESYPAELQALRTNIENHPLTTPYILTIQAGETLDEAIDLAIAPTPQIRDKIVSAVKNSTTTKTVWDKYWSKKKKKYCYSKRYVKVKPDFHPGIYLMTFGKNYTVTRVSRANNIPLNPKAYQNQQFLKNSCVAEKSKERAL